MSVLDGVDASAAPSGEGCADCLALQPSGWWFHLRRCATCGHIGCCDSSPAQHARAHYQATGHRLIQSFEPGEDWFWDFADDVPVLGPELAPPRSRPESQPAPGPAGAFPPDWQRRLRG